MSLSLIPDHAFKKITEITPQFLHSRGINLLLLDLDNTIAPYYVEAPEKAVLRWCETMEKNGVKLYLFSNSHVNGRVDSFATALGIGAIKDAGKPSTAAIKNALAEAGRETRQAALVGDQIFTDVLGANRAGISSIIVDPITFKPVCWQNILRRLRYYAEAPFRGLCTNRSWK